MERGICIYSMNYFPEPTGIGKYNLDISRRCYNDGSEVFVITTPPHYPEWEVARSHKNWWSKEKAEGIRIYRCPIILKRPMKGLSRILAPLSFALTSAPVALYQIIARRPASVLFVEPTIISMPVGIFAARMIGARCVLHVHDLEVDAAFAMGHVAKLPILKRLAKSFERFVRNQMDQIVTISDAMRGKILENLKHGREVCVVRNWVDLKLIKREERDIQLLASFGLSSNDIIVQYSGSLGAKQGIETVLQTAERLSSHGNIKFIIAGRGPMKTDVDRAAAVNKNLISADFQPLENFSRFLNLADIHLLPQAGGAADLLLPSKIGGLLATGRPIIVTANFGTEIANFLGVLCNRVEPDNPEALAKCIIELASTARLEDAGTVEARIELAETLERESSLERMLAFIRGARS